MALNILNSILPGGKDNASQDYKKGYEACEKKYKQLQQERDFAISMLHKVGYELGENVSILKNASNTKELCRERTSCDGCELYSKSIGCALKGDTPADWRVM